MNTKDDKREGLLEMFDENGNLTGTENYKDGELDGLVEFFDENGNLTGTRVYKDGELVEKWEQK